MKLTQYISLLLLTGAAASVVSCTEMDDYLRFTEGVSSTYTGKLDSAVFLAGNGRLLFHGELSSDPKVSRIVFTGTSAPSGQPLDRGRITPRTKSGSRRR